VCGETGWLASVRRAAVRENLRAALSTPPPTLCMSAHVSPSSPACRRRSSSWRRGAGAALLAAVFVALLTLPVKKYISLGVFASQVR